MLACIVQAQLLHSKAVACCRMRLLMQPGTFIVPMLACIVQAQLLHSKAVACCRMRLLMQPGTFHSAYAGLHRASAASSQQGCGMLSHAVAYANKDRPNWSVVTAERIAQPRSVVALGW